MYRLGDKIIDNCGNKVKFMSILKSKGYNIPLGIVIDFEEFKNIVQKQKLNFETIDKIEISDELIDRIFESIPKGNKYAIRSSANIEDCRNISLAGRYLTYLNVVPDRECFKDKIKNCFLSLYSMDNLHFYRKNNIDISKIEMNIIVQEMIESNVSGILFTVNPTNGKDSQIVLEFSKGSNDVVNGKTVPQRLVYDWIEDKYIEEPKINILGESAIKKIINISLNLQQELGFPIDVEFGIYDSKLYIFQVRHITKIEYKDIYYRFTNINFSNIRNLSRFMWSIDEKVFNNTISNFISTLNINNDIEKPIVLFKFSRLYWNLSLLKKILENIPGYVERNLDEELGIRIDYLDNGIESAINVKKKFKILPKKGITDILKKQIINIEEFTDEKMQKIGKLKEQLNNLNDERLLKNNTIELINLFYEVKSAYLWQILINIMYKTSINKLVGGILNKNEIQNLFIAIDDKYENAPYLHMCDTSNRIRQDADKMKFFDDNLDAEIFYLYRKDKENPYIKEFLTEFVDRYGYRSFNETDIIYKSYDEEILKVIKVYRDILELGNKFDPLKKLRSQNELYEKVIEKINNNTKKSQQKNIIKEIEFVRNLIRKTSILKDLQLLSQNMLRKYLLKLAKEYKEKYILDQEEDIFNLEYKDIIRLINGEDLESISSISNKNKIYFNSFRNYEPVEDIFPCPKQYISIEYNKSLNGIGASFGKVTARACIVNTKEDLKKIKKSDILVTKYIEQDLLRNIDITELSGIITECGGMLCHLAINARENRIPCIVGLNDATENIKNGENITMNGDTGEVII